MCRLISLSHVTLRIVRFICSLTAAMQPAQALTLDLSDGSVQLLVTEVSREVITVQTLQPIRRFLHCDHFPVSILKEEKWGEEARGCPITQDLN